MDAGYPAYFRLITHCILSPFCSNVGVVHFGPCPTKCTCSAAFVPVCGSDENTYSNQCEADCA